MKLELKHLAPYLPYGLKVMDNRDLEFKMTGFSAEYGDQFKMVELLDINESKYFGKFIGIRPILRPMSDLDAVIKGNQEGKTYNDLGFFTKQIQHCGKIIIDIYNLQYEDAVILFNNHFDVFNLIGQNLAIDINTIKS